MKAKYKRYRNQLNRIAENAAILQKQGIISEKAAQQFVSIAMSEAGEVPHPETGLPCWCGEAHPEKA